MNLVNELQVSAEGEDVLSVLRKARRLASKLGVDDIGDWLKAEQNGYSNAQDIPQYRMVKCSLVYQTNGPIPVGLGMVGNGIMNYPGGFVVDRPLPDSMAEVMALIEGVTGTKNGLYMQMVDDGNFNRFRRALDPYIANQVTFMLKMNVAQVRAIPEAVKDKVLDWACELEKRGVHGDNMTFNDKERELAHAITLNITNSQIEQLNNMGNNHKR